MNGTDHHYRRHTVTCAKLFSLNRWEAFLLTSHWRKNNFRLPPTSTKRKFHFSFLWCLSQVIFSKAIFGETWHQREQRGAWSRTKIYWLTAKNCSKLILFRGTPFIGDIANSKDRLSFLNLHTFVRCHGNVKSTYAKWPQCPVKHAYLLCMQAKLLGII